MSELPPPTVDPQAAARWQQHRLEAAHAQHYQVVDSPYIMRRMFQMLDLDRFLHAHERAVWIRHRAMINAPVVRPRPSQVGPRRQVGPQHVVRII